MKTWVRVWPIAAAVALGALAGFAARPSVVPAPVEQKASGRRPTGVGSAFAQQTPRERALAAVRGCRNLHQLVRLGPVLESLDNADIASLLGRLEESRDIDYLHLIVGWWTRRDAQAATAWIGPKVRRHFASQDLSLGNNFMLPSVLSAWAAAAPTLALETVRPFVHRQGASMLVKAALDAWPDRSPDARLRVLRDMPAGAGRFSALCQVAAESLDDIPDQNLPVALSRAMAGFEEAEVEAVLGRRLGRILDKLRALDLATEIGLEGAETWNELLFEAGKKNWAKTAAWLDESDDVFLNVHAVGFARGWVKKNINAALDWASENGAVSVRPDPPKPVESDEPVTKTVWQTALQSDAPAALEWLARQPASPSRDSLVEVAVNARLWDSLGGGDSEEAGEAKDSAAKRGRILASLRTLTQEMSGETAAHVGYDLAVSLAVGERAWLAEWTRDLPAGGLKENAEFALADVQAEAELSKPVTALRLEGKEGFVVSPHDAKRRPMDVRGLPSGTEVQDPYHPGRTLLIP